MNNFYRKNDLGINIEYTEIGKYDNKYLIYTDFTTDNTTPIGLKIYVDKILEDDKYEKVPDEEAKYIIDKFNSEVMNYRSK